MDIEIDIKTKKKQKKRKEADPVVETPEVYPTMLPTDDPLELETVLTFFDGGTKKSGSNWIDIPGWNNDYEEEDPGNYKMTEQYTTDWQARTQKEFVHAPKNVDVHIYAATDSRVNPDVIAEEYGEANDERWERKPLLTMAYDWQFPGNRWHVGGSYSAIIGGADTLKSDMGGFNIRAILKSDKDQEVPTAIIDPSMFHAQKARTLQMKWPYHVNELRPLVYHGFTGGTYGLQVKDLSKAWAHYINGPSSEDYTYEWIESPYFCPFDTTDDVNFKVTRTPNFEDDESSGLFIDGREFDVFLMPCRWAFVNYYHQQVLTGDTAVTSGLSDYSGLPPAPDEDSFDLHDEMRYYTASGSEENATVTANIIKSDWYVGIMWGRWPCSYTPTGWLPMGGIGDGEQEGCQKSNLEKISFFQYTDLGVEGWQLDLVGTLSLINQETAEDAKAHYLATTAENETAEQRAARAEDIYSGGGGDIHIIRDGSSYYVKLGIQTGNGDECGNLDCVKQDKYLMPPPEGSQGADIYNLQAEMAVPFNNPVFDVSCIWSLIENSTYWQQIIKPLRDAAKPGGNGSIGSPMQSSRIDEIPYGFGISPSKAGSLVAIIRSGGDAWYVWRKTNENFETEGRIRTKEGGAKGHLSFLSRNADGSLENYSEGSSPDGYNKYCDGEFPEQFSGDSNRKLTAVGRAGVLEDGEDDPGQMSSLKLAKCTADGPGGYTLHTPIYVLASKERAMADAPRQMSEWLLGYNFWLTGRFARVQYIWILGLSAHDRNLF
jgi:hypothetical protein